jgi:hypothetical protein
MHSRKDTISGDAITSTYGITTYTLSYQILKYSLTVLDPSSFSSLDLIKILDILQKDNFKISNYLFFLPEIEKNSDFQEFKKEKIERDRKRAKEVVKPRNLDIRYLPKFSKTSQTLQNVIEDHDNYIKYQPNVFSLISKVWFIKFQQDEWGLYPDHEKYKYIAALLNASNNNEELSISNTNLISEVKGTDVDKLFEKAETQDELSDSDLAEKLTSEEYNRFKDIGYDLLERKKSALERNRLKLYQKAGEELEKYRSYLLNSYGIKAIIHKNGNDIYFKTLYRSSREVEKSRQVVKNQIRNAIKDFKKSMPILRKHLRNSISTKLNNSIYHPEANTNWHISF